MNAEQLKPIIEAALMAAGQPLNIERLQALFEEDQQPERVEVRKSLELLQQECAGRSIELKEVSSGFRFQVRQDYASWVARLWEERPARYSRALMETLALIAYRQPITRPEIEDIRGVAVSSQIIKTLHEREWIRVVGHRDVPGKPALYGTTHQFVDYFNMKSLDDLPTLAEMRDLDQINVELDLKMPGLSVAGDVENNSGDTYIEQSAPGSTNHEHVEGESARHNNE
ncbi:MAG: SMC-Scp complex subunit ScpB [Gammaproteobacteria bacterium]